MLSSCLEMFEESMKHALSSPYRDLSRLRTSDMKLLEWRWDELVPSKARRRGEERRGEERTAREFGSLRGSAVPQPRG